MASPGSGGGRPTPATERGWFASTSSRWRQAARSALSSPTRAAAGTRSGADSPAAADTASSSTKLARFFGSRFSSSTVAATSSWLVGRRAAGTSSSERAVTTSAAGAAAAGGGQSPGAARPKHLVVMVNGLSGAPSNWDFVLYQLNKRLPPEVAQDMLLHRCVCV